MTEWWVSQAKHWCTACKVWTGGHPSQIRKHKDGWKHIENEKNNLERMKEDEIKKKKEDQDVMRQLADIERAAEAAVREQFGQQALASRQDSAQQQQVEKRQIQETVDAATAKRLKSAEQQEQPQQGQVQQVQPQQPQPQQPQPQQGQGNWTKHIDPNSQCAYYYNTVTKESTWVMPPDFVAAAPQAPPPPARQTANKAASAAGAGAAMPGAWEEVAPEESMFANPEEVAAAEEADRLAAEAAAAALAPRAEAEGGGIVENPLCELKRQVREGGLFNDEDKEMREKEVFQKQSLHVGVAEDASFAVASTRKRASGIRRKHEEE